MGLQPKYSDLILNLLVALAVSLVVNFSYVLLLIVDQKSDGQPRPAKASVIARGEEGTLRVSPDGHGYIVYENGDSVYVMMQRIYRMNLKDGDRLVANLAAPRRHGAHPVMTELRMRNGEEFDYSTLFNRPSKTTELALQLFYYLVVSFIMLSILTSVRRRYTPGRFVRHCIWCVLAAAALYMVAPVTEWRSGRIMLNCMGDHIFDYMLLLKCSFAVAVSMLYGWVYVLNSKQQAVVMENERLKNENLTTRYNMLVGQINPHFFFNSLNSLAMLVREKHDEKALTYIDQLSYTFRYIIQNGQSTLMTLDEELKFVEAYSYLFKIRYADKLFFDIDIEEKYRTWTLPALSLQPLIGNAVKHNTITRSKPFHISIRTENGWLVVSNPKVPKLEPEPSTGIGLENLRNRWHLITGRDIEIIDTDKEFVVRMPLHNPLAG
ncbi:sensor histidine kinase [Alistipes finegoldii]|uniref:sensor histidine kinase n=1 Tax=Alistipes finegoldii TaxID=214856 RepID=UPI00189FAA7E|nr:histidine kinase [Alistipes finegoldii]